MSKLFTLPAGSTAKYLLFAGWLIAIFFAFATQLPTKFTDAEKNESSSFLPGDAESTKALEVTEKLQGGEQAATVVVYRRDGGLTADDRAKIASDRGKLNTKRFRNTTPFAAPIFSQDDTSALMVNQIEGDGESDTLLDPVDSYRETVSDPGGGLEVKVTGAAGYSADAIKVFENINGTLLLAAGLLVFVLLILIYRSPLLIWIPLFAVIFAEIASESVGWLLTEAGITVNGQSSSILSVLVLGAGTDYALLLVSRYREELRRHEDKHEAMALALRTAGPAIFASGMTVIAGLLCLSLAEVNGTSGLGPIGAIGIAVAMVSMLTVLPAMLTITGRAFFWPFVPRFGEQGADETHGAWRRVAEKVAGSPRRVWIGGLVLLLVLAVGNLNFSNGLNTGNSFRGEVESVEGQKLLEKGFPAGANAPTDVIVQDREKVPAVTRALQGTEGVEQVRPVAEGAEGTLLQATLTPEPYSTEAFDLVPGLREAVKRAGGQSSLVGGPTAIEHDLRESAARDTRLIVPIAVLVVFLILVALLRALVLPLLLIGTVIVSFAAAMGVGSVVFDVIFGFPGADPSLPLFAFVFLVALGIDYNIFLMTRAREETLGHGTRAGMLRAVAVTGGVISAAGIVLAGTFSVLAVLPLVFLTEIGFVVAFGVLLDTFLVRSVLVPALVFDIGTKVWWPSTLAQAIDRREPFRPETDRLAAEHADGDGGGSGRRLEPIGGHERE